MKTTTILCWTFNILFAFMMLGSAVPDILSSPDAVKFMHDVLGYPLYFIPFIGIVKVLGVIAILIPGYRKIKEWAYAGLIFDLVGATYSVYSVPQQQNGSWYFMLIPLSVAVAAYYFYSKKQKMHHEAASATFAVPATSA